MKRKFRMLVAVGSLLVGLAASAPAVAQKPGGVPRTPVFDSPASMSLREESAIAVERAMMGLQQPSG